MIKSKIIPLTSHLKTFLTPSRVVQVLNAFQLKRPTTFRFNSLKVEQQQIPKLLRDISADIYRLADDSSTPHRSAWHPFAYKIDVPTHKLMSLPQYLSGQILFQNQSSMIPPLALSPTKDMNVLDMCAAPGGKTLGLLELMQPDARLTALDIDRPRFELLQKFMTIYAEPDIRLTMLKRDATRLKAQLYDAILCDAPCSGSGVIQLHDSRTLKHFLDIEGWIKCNSAVQIKLLDAAYQSLMPGGELVYSTCSIFPEENEHVVSGFLKKYSDMQCVHLPRPFGVGVNHAVFGCTDVHSKEIMRPLSFEQGLSELNGQEFEFGSKCLRIMPSSDSEGFFVAKFKKHQH